MRRAITAFLLIPIVGWGGAADDYVIVVKTDNPGVSADNEFTIPVTRTTGAGYNVDCDDDGVDEATAITGNSSYTCSYPQAGTYTIRVKDNNGDGKGFRRIQFYVDSTTQTDALKLIGIRQWGTAIWSSVASAYRGASNMLKTSNVDVPDLSEVQSLRAMFYDCNQSEINTTEWNTSNITNMWQTFRNAAVADPDVSRWDTSQVTTMLGMFKNARAAAPETGNWDTSQVTNMRNMFQGAVRANPDVRTWDVSQVTDMLGMFDGAVSADPDVTGWDVSQVTTMRNMFRNAVSFDRNLGHWDVSNVGDFRNFLTGAKLSTYNYDALLIGWEQLDLQDSLRFDGGQSTYCNAETARQNIIDDDDWTINDAGKHCPAPCEEVRRPLRAMHWTLISFPCVTGSNGVEALLGNALGTYGSDADWVMYEQTGADDYRGENTQKRRLSADDTVRPGKGYWIISAHDANLSVDSSLSGLAFTPTRPASDLGISNSRFDDLNMTRLPDSATDDNKTILLGNPFPTGMKLSDIYFSHGGGSGNYHPMSTDDNSPNAPYVYGVVYTYDHLGTDPGSYEAIVPSTPGFSDWIDPMTGVWLRLKAGQSGSNYLTFPVEK